MQIIVPKVRPRKRCITSARAYHQARPETPGSHQAHVYLQGEDELRHVCSSCNYVEYHNPKMVVGCLVEHQGKVLLCKRALEPCAGRWTLPAGYLELHESSAEGAARETWEEACAKVKMVGPYSHLDIPIIGQVRCLSHATCLALRTSLCAAGHLCCGTHATVVMEVMAI